MIKFEKITPDKKDEYEKYLIDGNEHGCEYSFANLYMWGRQSAAVVNDNLVLFSQYNRRSVYPFPVGFGEKKSAIDAIIEDAGQRGIPCRLTGLTPNDRAILEELYPDMFRFHCDRDFYDYVYDINDLSELRGKRYHSKKNRYNKFVGLYPDFYIEEINDTNIDKVEEMVEGWYKERLSERPDSDFQMEQAAIGKAFKHYKELGMEGIILYDGEEIAAITLASFVSKDTIDVHFEKARHDTDGSYAVINCEFAKHIRNKYSQVKYLNREDDMGIEGLRSSKESYRPHHMVEKCWACLLEEGYEY